MMAKFTFSSSLTLEEKAIVSQVSIDIILDAAETSKNPDVMGTSTIRLPEKQARIMYDNLAAGAAIRYGALGQAVCAVYGICQKSGVDRAETIRRMTAKVVELSGAGQRVSKHCVTPKQYCRLNVIDISTRIPNPRDFVRELIKDPRVEKVITPFSSAYNSGKVSVDANEPAIHMEIRVA